MPVTSVYRTGGGSGMISDPVWGRQGPKGDNGAPGAYQHGNLLVVDQVYGNDTTANAAAPYYTQPFQTIGAALAKAAVVGSASNPVTVWVLPGIYPESGLIIPDNCSLNGIDAQTCIIQPTSFSAGTNTCVTMGANTRFENFTLKMTSAVSGANLTGVLFPSGTSITGKMRVIIMTVSSSATGTEQVVCVLSNGTSSTSYSTPNAIQRCTLNATSAGTGIVRGIYVTNANRFAVRDIVVNATSTTGGTKNAVGVEATNTSARVDLKTSTIGGDTYDILQPSGLGSSNAVITIGATDLRNSNANGYGFDVSIQPNVLISELGSLVSFTGQGSQGQTPTGVYYLTPGTTLANFASSIVGIPITRKCIIFQGSASSSIALTTQTVLVEFFLSTSSGTVGSTALSSITLNSSNQTAMFKNVSTTFDVGQFLHIRCTISGTPLATGTNVFVNLLVY